MNDSPLDLDASFQLFWLFIVSMLVFVSSILVAKDAAKNRIPISGDEYSTNTGAMAWFLSCLLIWIITFPYYWFRRSAVLGARRSAATPVVATGFESELRGLARLRDDKLITTAEYDQRKQRLLGL